MTYSTRQQVSEHPRAKFWWAVFRNLVASTIRQKSPDLLDKFQNVLGVGPLEVSGDTEQLAHKALQAIDGASQQESHGASGSARRYYEQSVKVVRASREFIAPLVAINPYAAAAWTGVSLLLSVSRWSHVVVYNTKYKKLFLNSAEEHDSAMKGLSYVINLIMVYRWQEKIYLNDAEASPDFERLVRPLYTEILEYIARLLVHHKRSTSERWAKDAFSLGSWSDQVESIRALDVKCKDVTNVIAVARARDWRNKERTWQERLIRQPRLDREKENIWKLYSNYEAHKNLNPSRIKGTCEWFLNHPSFLIWRESQRSSLLWLSADPGCGKSVLSKYLVDRQGEVLTIKTEQPVVCYYFFKETDIDRRSASKAVCALLHQLVMQQPQVYCHLEEDFENKGSDFLSDTSTTWAMFLKAATKSSGHEVICVLDALDECEPASRKTITDSIVEAFSPPRYRDFEKPVIKFIVTSRPEFNIERDFRSVTRKFAEVRLRGEDESDCIQREIDIVIQHKVHELGSRIGLSVANQKALQENLTMITHRTYLWLYLTFDDIEKRLTLNKRDIAAISNTIPESVEAAYTAILNKSTEKNSARKLLYIVLAATRPLTLDEVNVAMNIQESDTSYHDLTLWPPSDCEIIIKNMCGLFLSVVDSRVYLIHQTAKEFLIAVSSNPCPSALEGPSSHIWKHCFPFPQSNLCLLEISMWFLQLQEFQMDHFSSSYEMRDTNRRTDNRQLANDGSSDSIHEMTRRDETTVRDEGVDNAGYDDGSDGVSDDSDWKRLCFDDAVEAVTALETKYRFFTYAACNWNEHFSQAGCLVNDSLMNVAAYTLCDPYSPLFKNWYLSYHDYSYGSYCDALSATNIFIAAEFCHFQVVKLLLEDGADPKAASYEGVTPLDIAAYDGDERLARLILQSDAMRNSTDREIISTRALVSAATADCGGEAVAILFLDNGAKANQKGCSTSRALDFAASNGDVGMVKLLLDHGARVNFSDPFRGGETILPFLEKRASDYSPDAFAGIIRLLREYQTRNAHSTWDAHSQGRPDN